MVKDEIWSISIGRIRAFFREQTDVTAESENCFTFGSCRILLTELEPGGVGIWAVSRSRVQMEGEDEDVKKIHRRFFLRFLSAGG